MVEGKEEVGAKFRDYFATQAIKVFLLTAPWRYLAGQDILRLALKLPAWAIRISWL